MMLMEISFHLRNLDPIRSPYTVKSDQRAAEIAQDEVAFENSRALTTALNNTPETRDDVVQRATKLVSDVNYPPPETIRMISNLLAIQMQADGGGSSS